jgi:hypothetical protein
MAGFAGFPNHQGMAVYEYLQVKESLGVAMQLLRVWQSLTRTVSLETTAWAAQTRYPAHDSGH